MIIHDSRRIVEKGPTVGNYQGRVIPEFLVTADGARHEFVGIGDSPFDMDQLRRDEFVIAPGLIYRRSVP